MNKEYIEREELIKLLDNTEADWCKGWPRLREHLTATFQSKNGIPTADVKPIVRGRWYDEDSFRLSQQAGGLHYAPIYRCSVCNKTVADNYISEHKYCLHCGAEMEEV